MHPDMGFSATILIALYNKYTQDQAFKVFIYKSVLKAASKLIIAGGLVMQCRHELGGTRWDALWSE